MNVTSALPRTVEELTPQWLTSALATRCPGIRVTTLQINSILWGTTTKVLAIATYAGDTRETPPARLCIKGEFDERVRRSLTGVTMTGTQVEAEFFNDLAPELGIPLPRHWYGGSEPGMGILILDDLTAVGARFGSPTEPWSVALVHAGLKILAKLHASTWGRRFPNITWLRVGSPTLRQYHQFLLSEDHWRTHFADPASFSLPPMLRDPQRCLRAQQVLWRHDDAAANCVIHGDAHLGNTCVDPSGQPFFIDWAGPCISSWAFDVSYFIAGSLTVSDRRASERALLSEYLHTLAGYGGPTLDFPDAWLEYQRHLMPGMVWATLLPSMQSRENVSAMAGRFVTAIMDHDSLGLLEQSGGM